MCGPATAMSSTHENAETCCTIVSKSHVWSEQVVPSRLRFQIANESESSGAKSRNALVVTSWVPPACVHVTISPVASALRCHTTRLPATRGCPSGTALLLTRVVVTSVADAESGASATARASVRSSFVMGRSLPIDSRKSTLAATRSGNSETNASLRRVVRVVRPAPRLDVRTQARGRAAPPAALPLAGVGSRPPGDLRTVEPVSALRRRPA